MFLSLSFFLFFSDCHGIVERRDPTRLRWMEPLLSGLAGRLRQDPSELSIFSRGSATGREFHLCADSAGRAGRVEMQTSNTKPSPAHTMPTRAGVRQVSIQQMSHQGLLFQLPNFSFPAHLQRLPSCSFHTSWLTLSQAQRILLTSRIPTKLRVNPTCIQSANPLNPLTQNQTYRFYPISHLRQAEAEAREPIQSD